MPIDFASIAASFETPYTQQLRALTLIFEELGLRLQRRLREASLLEVASRDYPTLGFHDDAVTLWIDRLQHQSLAPPPPSRSLGDTLERAGTRLVRGLGRLPEALREERLLPGLLGVAVRVFELIDASIARFERPTPGMFEPGRTASDLIGESVLLLRAVGSSTDHLRWLAGRLAHARDLFSAFTGRREARLRAEAGLTGGALVGAGAALTAGPAPESPAVPFAETLDGWARYILGTALVLPLLSEWLSLLSGPAGLRLRLLILDVLEQAEREIFNLRRQVLETFYVDMLALIRDATDYVWAVQLVFLEVLRGFLDFGLLYGDELLATVSFFLEDLSQFLLYWTVLFEEIRQVIEFIVNLDLRPFISLFLGPAGRILSLPGIPPITLRDLAAAAGDVGRIAARAAFLAWLYDVEALVWLTPGFLLPVDKDELLHVIDLLKQLVRAATRATPPLPAETRGFVYPGVAFPNLYEALFGPGAPDIRGTLRTLEEGLQRTVREGLETGMELLEGVSSAYDQASAQGALLGSPERYHAIAESSAQLAQTVFGSQAEALRASLAAQQPDRVAEAFAGWMATGGFQLIGEALPLYVEHMDRFWREQEARGEELTAVITPTSPHILARRALLSRVRIRQLTIEARGRPLDEALVQELARKFQGAVSGAYATGSEKLKAMGAGHG